MTSGEEDTGGSRDVTRSRDHVSAKNRRKIKLTIVGITLLLNSFIHTSIHTFIYLFILLYLIYFIKLLFITLLLIVICVILVAVTLSMSQHIDDMGKSRVHK